MLTQERLKELLHYDPDTGLFTRLTRCPNGVKVGDIAGSNDGHGYYRIRVDGKRYRAHRLAWLYITGKFPVEDIDHRYGVRHDNRFSELREATRRINNQNIRKAMSTSSLGVLGVDYLKDCGKYRAQLMIDGKKAHLGLYKTLDEASAAYIAAKREHHEGCTI